MSQRTPSHWSAISDRVAMTADAQGGLRRVELDDVGPRGEVRVPPHRQYPTRRLEEGRWHDSQVRRGTTHEVLRVRPHPLMVGRDVVGDEVEEKPNPSRGQLRPRSRESVGTAEPGINPVAANAVRGADDIRLGRVRKQLVHLGTNCLVAQGDLPAHRAALPDPHEPDGVHAGQGDGVPL